MIECGGDTEAGHILGDVALLGQNSLVQKSLGRLYIDGFHTILLPSLFPSASITISQLSQQTTLLHFLSEMFPPKKILAPLIPSGLLLLRRPRPIIFVCALVHKAFLHISAHLRL